MRRLTHESIEKRIRVLQMQAEKLKERERKPAIREIVSLMQKHGLAVSEIRAALGGAANGRRKNASKRGTRKVKPMYRHPKTGETWSGRGRAARWVVAAEKAGHKRTEFLVKKD